MKSIVLTCASVAIGLMAGWNAVALFENPTANRQGSSAVAPTLTLSRDRLVTTKWTATIPLIEAIKSPTRQCRAGLPLALEVPPSGIEQALEEINRLPSHSIRFAVERQLLFRWLEHDPERAMHWTMTNRRNSLTEVASQWFRLDREAAIAFAEGRPEAGERVQLFQIMASALADDDFEEALVFIQDHADRAGDRRGSFSSALYKLAQQDPQALAERLKELPPQLQASNRLVSAWSEKAPEEAFLWARADGDPELVLEVFKKLDDCRTALDLLSELSPEEQANAAQRLYRLSSIADLDEAKSLLTTTSGVAEETLTTIREKVDQEAQRRQAAENPEPAISSPPNPAEMALNLAEGSNVSGLRLESPAEAEALVKAIDALPETDRHNAHARYFDSMRGEGRFADAAAWSKHLPSQDSDTLNRVCELSAYWTQRDPLAATSWIEGLPAGSMKDWAVHNAARQWARTDPAAAEAWFARLKESFGVQAIDDP